MDVAIEFEQNWQKDFLKRVDEDGPWASWELYKLAYEVEKHLVIPEFEGLQAPKHLQQLTPLPHQLEVAKEVVEKTCDVEVIPPPEEKSAATLTEAEKNGHTEEVTKEEGVVTKEDDAKVEEKSKDEVVTKPASKTILSKMKSSLVKAKKAIIGKSPSSKTITSDASKGDL